jgi:hypothetical protein
VFFLQNPGVVKLDSGKSGNCHLQKPVVLICCHVLSQGHVPTSVVAFLPWIPFELSQTNEIERRQTQAKKQNIRVVKK